MLSLSLVQMVLGNQPLSSLSLIRFLLSRVKKSFGANVRWVTMTKPKASWHQVIQVLDELWNDFKLTPEVEIQTALVPSFSLVMMLKKSVVCCQVAKKARLLLAKLSMENNNFLILDEPTNHLDIDSKEVLENALIDFDGTLLFLSATTVTLSIVSLPMF